MTSNINCMDCCCCYTCPEHYEAIIKKSGKHYKADGMTNSTTNPIDQTLYAYAKPGVSLNHEQAKQELYAAILKCVPEKRKIGGPEVSTIEDYHDRGYNAAIDDFAQSIKALFDIQEVKE